MKQYSLNISFFKILFTVVFTLVFNNKLSANTAKITTEICATSFSIDNLNDEDTVVAEIINIDLCEEEEEEFSNDFLVTFKGESNLFKIRISSIQHFKVHLFSSEKKRFYILYCQLKTHL